MLDEQTLLTGTPEEKVIRCLKKAGWYEGRKTDITEVESYYSGRGITLTEPQKDIFREFYGIAEGWYFNYDGDLRRCGPDFEFYLMPGNAPELFYIDDRLDPTDDLNYDLDLVRDMQNLEQMAGEMPVFIGRSGYHYPSLIYAARSGRLWTLSNLGGDHQSHDNMVSIIKYTGEFERDYWSSVRMKQHIITKKK